MTTSMGLAHTRTRLTSNRAKNGDTRHSGSYSSTYSTCILALRVLASTSSKNTLKYSFLRVLILVLLARAKNNAPTATPGNGTGDVVRVLYWWWGGGRWRGGEGVEEKKRIYLPPC